VFLAVSVSSRQRTTSPNSEKHHSSRTDRDRAFASAFCARSVFSLEEKSVAAKDLRVRLNMQQVGVTFDADNSSQELTSVVMTTRKETDCATRLLLILCSRAMFGPRGG